MSSPLGHLPQYQSLPTSYSGPPCPWGHLLGHQNTRQPLPLEEQTAESAPSSRLMQPCRGQAWELSTGCISTHMGPSVQRLCTAHNIYNPIQQPGVPARCSTQGSVIILYYHSHFVLKTSFTVEYAQVNHPYDSLYGVIFPGELRLF